MDKVGIILDDLNPSELSYLTVGYLNSLVEKNIADPIIFTENISKPYIKPRFAVMNISEIASFDGVLISTNLSSTASMIRAVNGAKKIFYAHQLEWMKKQNFLGNVSIYRDKRVKLVAPSMEYAKAIQNYSNRTPDVIIEGFNVSAIMQYAKMNE